MFEIKPKTRKEIYMAYLAGDMSLELPEPLTRDEVTLYKLCQSHAYGSTTTVKEVLAEQKAENLEYMDGLGYFVPQNIGLVVGEKYIVTYNGVDYECVGIDGAVANSVGNVFLGDVATFTPGAHDSSVEPFAVIAMPEDGVTCIVPTAAQVAFESISIRQEVETIHPIDPKFLPSGGGEPTVRFTQDSDGNWTANKTVAELRELFRGSNGCILTAYSCDDDDNERIYFASCVDAWDAEDTVFRFSCTDVLEDGYCTIRSVSYDDFDGDRIRFNSVTIGSLG